MCLPARVVARSSTPTTASTDTISLCVLQASLQEELLPLLHVGQGQCECVRGGGEEDDGSGQLQEEGRHPLPSQMEINCVDFY